MIIAIIYNIMKVLFKVLDINQNKKKLKIEIVTYN